MSIRLRLTLLYTVILALTLMAFSTLLYVTQAQLTLDKLKNNLEHQAGALSSLPRHAPGPAGAGEPPPGFQPDATVLPGRWSQTRKLDGTVWGRTPDLGDTTLPLSAAGLDALRDGSVWMETAQVSGEPLLIYSQRILGQEGVAQIVQVASPMTERAQSLDTLRWNLVVGSSLAILAAFVVGWLLAGAALQPIHRITRTARAIGTKRDFGRRVQHLGPNDEIGQLATTFNGMLTELESTFSQVQDALQAQRRFVADASHELRTPLTTIRGNIELLSLDRPVDKEERADILADAKAEVERLIRLVQQLLVLARADAGRAVHCAPVAIRPIVQDVCRRAKLLAPQRTWEFQELPEVWAWGDCDALKQVLLILLDNAERHTPPSATLSVAVASVDESILIRVRDTGPGIAPELLPHIFERFVRGDASRTGGGAGLGLSIAQELIQAQNGTLLVESQPGQGSTFTLRLRRVAAQVVGSRT